MIPPLGKDSMNMASIRSSALLALGLAAVFCAPAQARDRYVPNRGLESVHQPVVQRTDYVFDLSAPGGTLPASELGRLAAWFDSLRIGYGDRISVDEPYGYAASQARQEVADVAASYGLLLSDGAPVTAGAVQPGTVRVIVSRSVASVPGCPDWHLGQAIAPPISTATNFGCAVNSNLAAMIANPDDLVRGQAGSSSVDAATATKAIKVYRDATPTGSKGLEQTKTTKEGQ